MGTVIRVIVIYIFIVVALRVVGKREFSQLSSLELVTLLIIPEMVSQALTQNDYSMTNALVGTATLIVLVYISSLLQHNNKQIDAAINGKPTVVVRHGQYMDRQMNEERISPEEIYNAIHQSGLERIDQVRWAILESDGKISIVPEEQENLVARRHKAEDEAL
ncbi:MAG: DUF421 domain-containing protein [Caldilineaceae bacterium]|nr:DUF421 domain-containing protein [Caldilineaceae bacterium]